MKVAKAIHIRKSFTALTRAPEVAVLPLAEGVVEAGLEDEVDITKSLLLLGKGNDAELEEERDELAPRDVELDPDGGGTTALALTSLPIPQGIFPPDGWFAFSGATGGSPLAA